jgi:putative sterol carrier protein
LRHRQPPVIWTIDLKNGDGKIVRGKEGKADATFTLLDEDAVKLFDGKLQPQTAFMQGKIKIRGNIAAAMRMNADMFPKKPKL